MYAVELHNLSKTYPGGKRAVQNVSLSLEPGEVFGFLGPNGAGKTTTVKLLTGMLTPTEGGCRVLGADPAGEPERIHAVSGVVTEHARMYDNLTGKENLVFYAETFGMASDEAAGRAETLLKEMDLQEAKDRKLAAWSTGMRQRLSLARALIHRPKVLFLDEPTSGLDPESAQNVNRMIREMAGNSGITVFLCTHQLRYAQEICTRYGLIEEGQLLASGTLEELRADTFPEITLQIRAGNMPPEMGFQQTGARAYETSIRSEEEIPEIVRRITAAGGAIYQVEAKQPDLEEIYFALTAAGKSVTGKSAAGKSAAGKSAAGKPTLEKTAGGKPAAGKTAAVKAVPERRGQR